ncbi:hypothetical protein [Rhodococcus sp. H29-C3]|uniref:hypothetical protein n=1 Tax=Rhodococcus sp. H29-C3 TaxID=3046307 RepID=UPI0024BBDEA9|nr:hypothetical protein [Rhodococcus sp. H29-C3]MDJ0363040.1 hypothetical protein [Rhodococcus sp. H29-C3]
MTTPHCADDQPTPPQLFDARGWLLDCGFSDELIDDLNDSAIVRFVDREYEGGWAAFLLDSTGRLVERQIVSKRPSATTDAVAQWTFMLAKAHTLGVFSPDAAALASSSGAGL